MAARPTRPLWFWIVVALPALIGVLGALWVQQSPLAGSLVQLRYELAHVVLACGLALSIGLLALFLRIRSRRQERARRLAQVREQERERHRSEHRRFTRRLDHELKNPLTTIAAALANIRDLSSAQRESDGESDALLAEVNNVQTQAARLTRLTDDLRKLDAFEEQPLAPEAVALKALFTELEVLCEQAPEFADRQLSFELPDAPWPVPDIKADRELMLLALYNLLDNAAKYSGAGDTIEVRGSEDNGRARIDISDTGVGVAPDEQALVFDELYRGRNVRARDGSGIGLTLVRRIVERHQGTLEIDSKESVGTRIVMWLPLFS